MFYSYDLIYTLELQSVSYNFKYFNMNNQYCAVQSNTNIIPNMPYGNIWMKSYQHCPQRCCCMEVEHQLLPVDSPLGPPHWTAAGGEKPLPGLLLSI